VTPEQPLELIPSGARTLDSVDLERVRASPYFERMQSLALGSLCARGQRSHFLVHRTRRIAFAVYDDAASGQVAVLRGQYGEPDLAEALAHSPWPGGADPRARTRRPLDGFSLHSDGSVAAVLLSPELLVIGHDAQVRRVVAVARGRARRARTGAHTWLPQPLYALLERARPLLERKASTCP
jgi:hypothetical protein